MVIRAMTTRIYYIQLFRWAVSRARVRKQYGYNDKGG